MVAKSGPDVHWTEFDGEVPKLTRSRGVLPYLFTVGFYFILSLFVLTGVIAATFNVPVALITAVGHSLGSFFEQLSALFSFWSIVAVLIGEMLWLLLTGQPDLCFMRILELARILNLC